MQCDETIWQTVRFFGCSLRTTNITGENFCKSPYNVTGICNRSSCPLANSRYATIRQHDNGVFYLYMKTIERAHSPKMLWEQVKLPRNYDQALEAIDTHLMYWPKFLVHKIKQRLTKMTQMQIRMRKLALKTREKIVTDPRKERKREARRAEKAEKAAVLEKAIENELIERLKRRVYQQGDIVLHDVGKLQPAYEEQEEEEEEEEVCLRRFVEGYDDDELEEDDDFEDFDCSILKSKGGDEENAGITKDEEADAIAQRKAKRKATLVSKKHAKDSKSKKTRVVLVEVEREDVLMKDKVIIDKRGMLLLL